MKNQLIVWAGVPAFLAAMLSFSSCSTTPEGKEAISEVETPSGAVIVDTYSVSATVTAIDASTRKVTLTFPDGKKTVYKCGPEVVNFPQIEIGDKVRAKVTEEAAIFIGTGAPPNDVAAAGVALAPVGYKPGGAVVNTAQATAKITAVDAKAHKVTLKFADGSSKTVKVGSKVNLAGVQAGQDVTVQLSEGLAISVQKP
jgi:hypothetical protein